jgi:hypothetical protein
MPDRRLIRWAAFAGLAAVALGCQLAQVTGSALAQDGNRMSDRTITVSASGSVSAAPDRAVVNAGVMTEAATAREALTQNNLAMKKVIDGLKGLGIEARDIQTVAVNLQPRYGKARPDGSQLANGFQAHNQVRIVVRALDRLGDVLDQAVTLGANQTGGIGFEVGDAETLKDAARKVAIANARRRAETYAAASGVGVGQVLTIAETVQAPGPRGGHDFAVAARAVPIEAGSVDLTVTVHVTWALR